MTDNDGLQGVLQDTERSKFMFTTIGFILLCMLLALLVISLIISIWSPYTNDRRYKSIAEVLGSGIDAADTITRSATDIATCVDDELNSKKSSDQVCAHGADILCHINSVRETVAKTEQEDSAGVYEIRRLADEIEALVNELESPENYQDLDAFVQQGARRIGVLADGIRVIFIMKRNVAFFQSC